MNDGRALIVQGDDLCCCCLSLVDEQGTITGCGCVWCYVCVGREHHTDPHDCEDHGCTEDAHRVEFTP